MRPKKIILIVSPDEDLAGHLSFVLRTTGLYRILRADDATTGFHTALDHGCELVMVDEASADDLGVALITTLKATIPWVPVMLLHAVEREQAAKATQADCFLPLPYNAADMLERLRFSTRRKRGPRRGSVRASGPVLVDVKEARTA